MATSERDKWVCACGEEFDDCEAWFTHYFNAATVKDHARVRSGDDGSRSA